VAAEISHLRLDSCASEGHAHFLKGRITMTNLELSGMVAVRDYERRRAQHLREAAWFSALAATQGSTQATTRRTRFLLPSLVNWFSAVRPAQTVAQSHGNA
jgi:hypothetical protein